MTHPYRESAGLPPPSEGAIAAWEEDGRRFLEAVHRVLIADHPLEQQRAVDDVRRFAGPAAVAGACLRRHRRDVAMYQAAPSLPPGVLAEVFRRGEEDALQRAAASRDLGSSRCGMLPDPESSLALSAGRAREATTGSAGGAGAAGSGSAGNAAGESKTILLDAGGAVQAARRCS